MSINKDRVSGLAVLALNIFLKKQEAKSQEASQSREIGLASYFFLLLTSNKKMVHFTTKIFSLLLLCCLFSKGLMAQNYWQQEVDYHIKVRLDDSTNSLSGNITMDYTNHSPNALPFIYIHLMPNAYMGGKSVLNNQLLANDEQSLQFANTIYKGYIDSLQWKINGTLSESKACRDTIDIIILELAEPLLPGQTVRLETPFYVKLPSSHISRMGFKDYGYYITQWYPKPAVYDSYGWHPMSYLDRGEFFSEFGNYEVEITVPQNFVVAATGNLITPEEILAQDSLDAYSRKYVYPKKRKYTANPIVPSKKMKTVTYRINNVHDFAFCADPELLLLKDTIVMDNRNIVIQSFIKREHMEDWKNANQYLKEAIEFYSNEVSAYPYNVFSLVDVDDITGGDMEYPTLAFINNSYSIEEGIVHEVGHSWFYGVVASNERDEPWMDEGFNTFYETKFFTKKYPDNKIHYYANILDGLNFPYHQRSHTEYYSLARLNKDQPVKTPSHLLSDENYWTLAYSKPAAFAWYLYNICGEDTFKRAMKEYYETWKFRHPGSADMQEIFKKYIGEKSDWFFEQGMITNEKLNYQIKKVKKSGDNLLIEIINKGEIEAPIYVETFNAAYKNLNTYTFDPISNKGNLIIPYNNEIEWIAIDRNMSIPDVNLSDNYVKIHDGKKVTKPTRFNFFSSFDNPFRNHVYYGPGLSGNFYDALQLGMIFHNYGFVPKKTEWFAMPMFAFGSVRPAFLGAITHTKFFKKNNPDRLFFKTAVAIQSYKISTGIPLWSFQLSPEIKFIFERRNIYSPLIHEVGLKNQLVVTDVDPSLLLDSRWKFLMQNLLYYKVNFKKRLWTIQNTFSFEHVYDFGINYTFGPLTSFTPALKLYNELKVCYTYFKGKSTIQLRVFAGTFLTTPSMVTDTRFRLSGWKGQWDYAFNDYYLGRSESAGFLSQQAAHRDGDFKTNTFVGQTDKWMITANIEWDIPMIYAGGYLDIGTYSGAGSFVGSNAFVYNAGLYLRTPDRSLEIYFPFVSSSDIKADFTLNKPTYWERIRFTVQLQNLQIIKTIRKLFI